MTAIETVAAGVNPLGNPSVTQKNTPKASQASGDRANHSTRSDGATATDTKTDTVDISAQHTDTAASTRDVPQNASDAAALLEDIKRQLQQEEQQNLDQVHNLNSQDMVAVLA